MSTSKTQKTAHLVWESRTGTTRALVDWAAVALGRRGWRVKVSATKAVDPLALEAADLVVFGSYCASNQPGPETRKLWSLPLALKSVAAIVTHATYEVGPYYAARAAGCETEFEAFTARSAQVRAGYFHCRGRASWAVRMFVRAVVFRGGAEGAAWGRTNRDQPTAEAWARLDEFVGRLT